jgi:hypothetical protein
MLILDNVKISASGINSTAVDVPQAVITNCCFNVDNPFIINRHGAEFYAVDLSGDQPSEVSFSEFHGGQGCLSFKGDHSRIHHNYMANKQTVTNHYSIMAMGDSSLIFSNKIEPEIGSGIEVYVHRGIEIFNNNIRISASPPTCEYGHEEYSTAAVRIADYNAKPGTADGCFGNRIYGNRITVIGKDYPEFTDYIPMAWAVFYSSSAGDNYIYGNDIYVMDLDHGSKNEVSAFYIGGGTIGGRFYSNRITSDVPVAWIGNPYGAASDVLFSGNTIVCSPAAGSGFKPFRIGWNGSNRSVADNIIFQSERIEAGVFGVDATDQPHFYSVWWKLTVHLTGRNQKPMANIKLVVNDKNNHQAAGLVTDAEGMASVLLPEYRCRGMANDFEAPYSVISDRTKTKVILNEDSYVDIELK